MSDANKNTPATNTPTDNKNKNNEESSKLISELTQDGWKEKYLQMVLTNTTTNISRDSDCNYGQQLCDSVIMRHYFAAQQDPQFMARALIYARNNGIITAQAIMGLAVLSGVNTDAFAAAFSGVIQNLWDLGDFTLALQSLGRGEGGRAVKREAVKMLEGLTEQEALEYAGPCAEWLADRARACSLRDLLRLYHPKASNTKSDALFSYIVKEDKPDKEILPQVWATEEVKKRNRTDRPEETIGLIRDYNLPDNVIIDTIRRVPTEVCSILAGELSVKAFLSKMPLLYATGVITGKPDEKIISRLEDTEALINAKISPFRFVDALGALNAQMRYERKEDNRPIPNMRWLTDKFETAMKDTAGVIQNIKGRTAVLLDISECNRRWNIKTALFAASIYRAKRGSCTFMLLNCDPEIVDIPKLDGSIFDFKGVEDGGFKEIFKADRITDGGLRLMLHHKMHYDNIIVVTDEDESETCKQSVGDWLSLFVSFKDFARQYKNTEGGIHFTPETPLNKALREYRSEVNPNVKTFVVNISSYDEAVTPIEDKQRYYFLGDEFFDRFEGICASVAFATQGYTNLVETVSEMEL